MMKGIKQFAAILLIIVMLSGVGIGLIFSAGGAGQETPEDETTLDETAVDGLVVDDESLVVPENTDSPEADLFILNSPKANDTVKSPLSLSGTAKGNMFFEGQFDLRIEDSNGKELGASYATSTEDWMTENYIQFTANLEFETPTTASGNLILKNSNPSDLPEYVKELIIPVNF
jgi:hypothetical protein